MRVVGVMMAFLSVLLALVPVTVLGHGSTNVMVAVEVSLVPTFVRLIRGNVLLVREPPWASSVSAPPPSPSGAGSQQRPQLPPPRPGICAGPGVAIMTTVVAVNLVGDTFRDVLDPRLRSLANPSMPAPHRGDGAPVGRSPRLSRPVPGDVK